MVNNVNDTTNKIDDEQVDDTQQTSNDAVQTELNVCQEELQNIKAQYMRVNADLQNFRNRIVKERMQWSRDSQAELILGLLSVLDDFDRALAEHEKDEHDEKFNAWLEGFELIGKQLYKFLYDKGVREIDCSTVFDPEVHEAIAQLASPEHKTDDIVEVFQKGYLFNDKVIRPAKVSVAK